MPLQLPTAPLAPTNLEPQFMLITAAPKTGKTSACLQLPNSLLIDLEGGARMFGGMCIDLQRELIAVNNERKKNKEVAVGLGTVYLDTARLIEQANIDNGKPVYDFIIIDNASVLGELAYPLATRMYKNSVVGKNFKGTNVTTEVAGGSGWNWYADAFLSLVNPFKPLVGKCLILIAHTKNVDVNKSGYGTFNISDVDIVGKSKQQILRALDTQALMIRSKEATENGNYQNILTFRSRDEGDVIGCRSPYLANKDIIISEYNPQTYELTSYWERIFPSIKE